MWKKYLETLYVAAKRHATLVREIRDASKGQLSIRIDYYVHAVVSRSLHMLNGFTCLVQTKNAPACLPFLRFAIDTNARFYALWIVTDPARFVTEVLNGVRIDSLQLLKNSNKRMTDSLLVKKLDVQFPDYRVQKLYEFTSGFVHFSSNHIFGSIKDASPTEVTFTLGNNEKFQESFFFSLISRYCEMLVVLFTLLGRWRDIKLGVASF
jgi:hypothetical protein